MIYAIIQNMQKNKSEHETEAHIQFLNDKLLRDTMSDISHNITP